MANTTFIVQEKGGIRSVAPSPSVHQPEGKSFGIFDAVLLVGFLAAFVGLVLLLAK